MWRRTAIGVTLAVGLLAAAPAAWAQDSSVAINLGYFALRGQESRAAGDVLNANRCIDTTFSCEPLLFDIKDFNGFTISGDYILGLGDYFEATGGLGYYQNTVHSVYEFLTNADGPEIQQDLKLREVPITATVRFIPTTRLAAAQPYIAVGAASLNCQATEAYDPGDN